MIRALVRAGAHVDCRDSEEATPLLVLAASGRADCLQAMVKEFGADLLARDVEGRNAIHIAAGAGQVGGHMLGGLILDRYRIRDDCYRIHDDAEI